MGVKVTRMAQEPDALMLVPQVSVSANSDALGPVKLILMLLNATVPAFVSVTDCAALVLPTLTSVNVRLAGATLASAAVPVPDIVMSCGLP